MLTNVFSVKKPTTTKKYTPIIGQAINTIKDTMSSIGQPKTQTINRSVQPQMSTQKIQGSSESNPAYAGYKAPAPYVAPKIEIPKPEVKVTPDASTNLLNYGTNAALKKQTLAEKQLKDKEDFLRQRNQLTNQQLREQLPAAQKQFGEFKAGTEATIADLLAGGERQKGQARDYYGEAQRLAAQTARETQAQTGRTFANLGTLDSRGEGSFQQATENQQSDFNRYTQQNLKAQADKLTEIDSAVGAAERNARATIVQEEAKMNELARNIEYAVANNDLQTASDLTDAFNQSQQYIYDIEDSVASMKYQFGLEQQKLENEMAILAEKKKYGSPETFQGESNLRSEFFSRTKDNKYNEVAQSYDKILNASDSAAGDLGLVFSFMKLLDPSSTVREGEFANAQNATGVPSQVLNAYNRAITGERLNPAQREDFKTSALGYVTPVIKQQKEAEAYYRDLAIKQGLNPDNVVGGYAQYDTQAQGDNINDPLGIF